MRRALTFAAVATLCLGAPALATELPRLYVVAFKAPPTLTYTGKRLAQTVAAQALKQGTFRVVGPDAVEERLGRRAYLRLVACGGEARCVAEADVVLDADRVVIGQLVQGVSTYQVRMSQVDVKTGRALSTVARVVPIGSRRLWSDVADASRALLRGEPEGLGALFVSASVPRAEVRVDGKLAGYTPLVLRLKPGEHTVDVEKEGYAKPERKSAEVADGDITEMDVPLTPLSPGADAGGG